MDARIVAEGHPTSVVETTVACENIAAPPTDLILARLLVLNEDRVPVGTGEQEIQLPLDAGSSLQIEMHEYVHMTADAARLELDLEGWQCIYTALAPVDFTGVPGAALGHVLSEPVGLGATVEAIRAVRHDQGPTEPYLLDVCAILRHEGTQPLRRVELDATIVGRDGRPLEDARDYKECVAPGSRIPTEVHLEKRWRVEGSLLRMAVSVWTVAWTASASAALPKPSDAEAGGR